MNKKLLLSLGSIAAIAAPVAAVVACGSDDKDTKDIDAITKEQVIAKIKSGLKDIIPHVLPSVLAQQALDKEPIELTNGVKAVLESTKDANDAEGKLTFVVELTKGKGTARTIEVVVDGFKTTTTTEFETAAEKITLENGQTFKDGINKAFYLSNEKIQNHFKHVVVTLSFEGEQNDVNMLKSQFPFAYITFEEHPGGNNNFPHPNPTIGLQFDLLVKDDVITDMRIVQISDDYDNQYAASKNSNHFNDFISFLGLEGKTISKTGALPKGISVFWTNDVDMTKGLGANKTPAFIFTNKELDFATDEMIAVYTAHGADKESAKEANLQKIIIAQS